MENHISKTGISKCYRDGPPTFEYKQPIDTEQPTSMWVSLLSLTLSARTPGGAVGKCWPYHGIFSGERLHKFHQIHRVISDPKRWGHLPALSTATPVFSGSSYWYKQPYRNLPQLPSFHSRQHNTDNQGKLSKHFAEQCSHWGHPVNDWKEVTGWKRLKVCWALAWAYCPDGNKWDKKTNQEDQESKLTDQRVSDKMNLRVCDMGKNVGSGARQG